MRHLLAMGAGSAAVRFADDRTPPRPSRPANHGTGMLGLSCGQLGHRSQRSRALEHRLGQPTALTVLPRRRRPGARGTLWQPV